MTTRAPVLTGYIYSVYTRAAQIALIEKGVQYEYCEYDPFDPPQGGAAPHPFGRVPVLQHGGFKIYETTAITTYVDEGFGGPPLMPEAPVARARVSQVVAMVDAYAYWPLMRQVYSHAVFRPAMGEQTDHNLLTKGLHAAPTVLSALEEISREGLALAELFSLADCHLAPMIAGFTAAPEGQAMLSDYPALENWWHRIQDRPSLQMTHQRLPAATDPR